MILVSDERFQRLVQFRAYMIWKSKESERRTNDWKDAVDQMENFRAYPGYEDSLKSRAKLLHQIRQAVQELSDWQEALHAAYKECISQSAYEKAVRTEAHECWIARRHMYGEAVDGDGDKIDWFTAEAQVKRRLNM